MAFTSSDKDSNNFLCNETSVENYWKIDLTNEKTKANIATRLHTERINAGLSLDGLALKIGYSKPTVVKWEKGWKNNEGNNTIPTLDQLIALAKLYNCTPDYLLCEYDCKTKEMTDINRETGLTPTSIELLQKISSTKHGDPNFDVNCLFLSFLNYFIENSASIYEPLLQRQKLASLQKDFDNEGTDKDIIRKSCEAFGLNSTINADPQNNHLDNLPFKHLLKNHLAKTDDKDRSDELAQKCIKYYTVLTPTKIKLSEFSLYDSFLDIVKDFFKKYPEIDESCMNVSDSDKALTQTVFNSQIEKDLPNEDLGIAIKTNR